MMTTQTSFDFRAATDDGALLQAYRQGQGRPLLLVSGLGGIAAFWNEIAATLGRSFETLRFDQRGLGGSSRGETRCDIDRLARDAFAVMDAAGIERAVVIGHSTGGCIAQAMARHAPERIDGLILSAAWLKACRYMTALFGSRRAILDCNPQAYAATSTLAAYPPRWLEAHWHVYERAMATAPVSEEARAVLRERIDALLAFDGGIDIAALPMPVLVMGARDDMVVPVHHQEAIAAALPGCRRAIMETGGHLFPNSRPDFFTASVAEWLGEL